MSPARILLLDADPLIEGVLRHPLEHAGMQVMSFAQADEAAAALTDFQPDLAIVDWRAAGLDRLPLGSVQREGDSIPFISLSDLHDRDAALEAENHGSLRHHFKPFLLERVLPSVYMDLSFARRLRTLLASRQQIQKSLLREREIGMAIGLLMDRLKMDQMQAFETLQSQAQLSQIGVADLAAGLLDAAESINNLGGLAGRRPVRG